MTSIDTDEVIDVGGPIARYMRVRTQRGAAVKRLNRTLTEILKEKRFSAIWVDKGLLIWPDTVKLMSASAICIHYNPDNPFGPRNDPGWGTFLNSLPLYDVHVVPREKNVAQYLAAGAKQVEVMPFSYESSIHFPPSRNWGEGDRPIDVSFIGTPHDDRASFLVDLATKTNSLFGIKGANWGRALKNASVKNCLIGAPVYNNEYREAIWKSKVNLGLIARSNEDPYAHRSFEIAACGGFLMATRTLGHLESFAEDREAVFFSSVEECADKILYYLPRPDLRSRIAAEARARAVRSGYDNKSRLAPIIAKFTK